MNGRAMKAEEEDDIRPEYDFTNAVRGKYYERYKRGTNIVLLEPDVAEAFPTSDAVNDALRSLLRIAMRTVASSRG
ncbi:MAG TPA: hypothetical protein DD490_25435 [Acidobacteria bacterium]|nr:hypothetical protein [Acidobacteriota bacterium]